MYVVPFCMGPLGSKISQLGVEITDSPYVVTSMRIMTRMGTPALDEIGDDGFFVPAVHTVGAPLEPGQSDVAWPCNDTKYIVHFPETREIWSYGSGYGGNALLGKKCFALRIASVMARDEGWMAEHMLILKLTPPQGEPRYVTAAFPSACGKTNLAMLQPTIPGLEGRDRRRRHRLDALRRRRPPLRDQPRGRLLRRRARHRRGHQRQRGADLLRQQHLHQRRAHRRRRRLVGGPDRDAAGRAHRLEGPSAGRPSPTSRRPTPTAASPPRPASARRSPRSGRTPKGVPISAILFGGRRATAVPLVTESFDWQHGIFLGASVSSETTAAAAGAIGQLRRDPFAMLPFCGYNMGDYMGHWLEIGESGRRRRSCRGSTTSTGSARTTTASGCGPGSARTAAS